MTWDPSIGQSGNNALGHCKVSGKLDTDFRSVRSVDRLGRIQSNPRRKKYFDELGPVSKVVGC